MEWIAALADCGGAGAFGSHKHPQYNAIAFVRVDIIDGVPAGALMNGRRCLIAVRSETLRDPIFDALLRLGVRVR